MSDDKPLWTGVEQLSKHIKIVNAENGGRVVVIKGETKEQSMNCDFCTHSKVCKYKEGMAKLAKAVDESIKAPYPYKIVVDCELQDNCMTVQGWNQSLVTTPCVKEKEHE